MTTRWIFAALLMLGASTAWAQNGTESGNTTAPADEPAMADSATPADEEAGTTESSGPLTATDKIVDRFMTLDTDASEGVSFEEYMAMVQQRADDRFKSMDTNGDGEVTADEYRAFWQARKAQWYRLKR